MTRTEIRIGAPWDKASAWARITTEDALQLELYDYSPEANSSLGNDVAWIWTVEAEHMPALLRLLPASAGVSDEALLTAVTAPHETVHGVRDWLRAQGIALREDFDSWA